MKQLLYAFTILLLASIQFSCASSQKTAIEIKDEINYKMAEKYFNNHDYLSAFNELKIIMNLNDKTIRDTMNIHYKKAQTLYVKCEELLKSYYIDKCMEALNVNDYDLVKEYIKSIPQKDSYGSRFSNLKLLDSLNFNIALKLLSEDKYSQSMRFCCDIRNVNSNSRMILGLQIKIGENAINNGDLQYATSIDQSISSKKLDSDILYFAKELINFEKRIDSLKSEVDKKIIEENKAKEKLKPQFEVGGLKIIINSANNWYDYNEFSSPRYGYVYFVLDVTIINNSSKMKSVNPLYFTLKDSDGYSYNVYPLFELNPLLGAENLSPGDKVRGFISFEVLNSSHDFRIKYDPIFDF